MVNDLIHRDSIPIGRQIIPLLCISTDPSAQVITSRPVRVVTCVSVNRQSVRRGDNPFVLHRMSPFFDNDHASSRIRDISPPVESHSGISSQ